MHLAIDAAEEDASGARVVSQADVEQASDSLQDIDTSMRRVSVELKDAAGVSAIHKNAKDCLETLLGPVKSTRDNGKLSTLAEIITTSRNWPKLFQSSMMGAGLAASPELPS